MARLVPLISILPMAFAAASCSDPEPTPAAVGISISLRPPDKNLPNLGGRSCTAGSSGAFTYIIGQPAAGHTIENGKKNVSITCQVQANGTFTANMTGNDENGHDFINFIMNGRITDKTATTNQGAVSFNTPKTGALYDDTSKFPPCTFGPASTLKPGALLTDFDCPIISGLEDTTSGCAAHGSIAIEYCKTGQESN
jgi:hypothetical protein